MMLDLFERFASDGKAGLLRSDSFASLAELRAACEACATPTLVVVEGHQLESVLSWLDNRHDVCLADVSEALITHRLKKLSAPAPGTRDALTGLLSPVTFHSTAELAATSNDAMQPLSLILCNIDHFKRLNDVHGHAVCDEVLRSIASELASTCGKRDLVARHAGEEFAVLSFRDRDSIAGLSERIRRTVEDRFAGDLRVTVSVGATTICNRDALMLFNQADEALYAAKAAGRNCCVHFADMQLASEKSGQDTALAALENRARVLSERVANYITLRSRSLVNRAISEAQTDGLTQFYTRAYLDQRLAREMEVCEGHLTIAFVDLDHFGQVNKRHGWPTGDKILREVCDAIRAEIRESDWVGRYGGEEFCIVMQHTDLSTALVILERLRESVEKMDFYSTAGARVAMTLSIGAIQSVSRQSHEDLLELASKQALKAKGLGRNCVCGDKATIV